MENQFLYYGQFTDDNSGEFELTIQSEKLNRSAASLWYIAKLNAPRKTANKNRTRDTQGMLLPQEVKR